MNSVENRIMEAAERLFARSGFQQTTVQDITKLAGCNKAAVSYYFGGKDALYMAACRHSACTLRNRCIRGIEQLLGKRDETVTLERLLWEVATAFLQPLLLDLPEGVITSFLTRVSLSPHAPHREQIADLLDPIADVLRDALKTICPALSNEQTYLCIASVLGQIHGIAMEQMQPGIQKRSGISPVNVEMTLRHFVTFSAAGIRQYISPEDDQFALT